MIFDNLLALHMTYMKSQLQLSFKTLYITDDNTLKVFKLLYHFKPKQKSDRDEKFWKV